MVFKGGLELFGGVENELGSVLPLALAWIYKGGGRWHHWLGGATAYNTCLLAVLPLAGRCYRLQQVPVGWCHCLQAVSTAHKIYSFTFISKCNIRGVDSCQHTNAYHTCTIHINLMIHHNDSYLNLI